MNSLTQILTYKYVNPVYKEEQKQISKENLKEFI
jgi:hypothetical protein